MPPQGACEQGAVSEVEAGLIPSTLVWGVGDSNDNLIYDITISTPFKVLKPALDYACLIQCRYYVTSCHTTLFQK